MAEPGQVRIFRARRVRTMDAADGEALAAAAGHVLAVGELAGLRRRFPEAPVDDFGDATIAPGFNDAHMHLSTAAENLLHTDLSPGSGVHGAHEALRRLADAATSLPPGAWLRGSRYDDGKTSGPLLTRADLDRVAGDHPALVVHVAGHWGIANSRALALAGIDEKSPDPPGGRFGRDVDGRLNGLIYERALFRFTHPGAEYGDPVIPSASLDEWLGGLDRAQQMFHAAGLTSVADALASPADVALFQEALPRGRLSARVNVLLAYDHFPLARDAGLTSGFGGDRLRFAGIKLLLDGAIGGRTCWLEEPYEGRPDDYGMQTLSDADLRRAVQEVVGAGWRLCVHANGDRAIRLLLHEMEAAAAPLRPAARHRIEHCSLVAPDILQAMRRLGLVAVPFAGYAYYHGGRLVEWYGAERVERMFAHRSFIDAGVPVAGSSDFPCGPYEPLVSMQSCVTRRGEDGVVVGASQRISPREALGLFTTGAAYATGEERLKGCLAPGMLADFVVLGADPLETDPSEIAGIPVRATYVGGEQVWPRAN